MNIQKSRERTSADKKTAQTVEEEILEALSDFSDAIEKGRVTERLTCRQIRLDLKPEAYGPDLVKKTRKLLGLSQSLFARFLGISVKTVRSWEQGVNVPHAMACRFMDEIRIKPEYWRGRLRESSISLDGLGGVRRN